MPVKIHNILSWWVLLLIVLSSCEHSQKSTDANRYQKAVDSALHKKTIVASDATPKKIIYTGIKIDKKLLKGIWWDGESPMADFVVEDKTTYSPDDGSDEPKKHPYSIMDDTLVIYYADWTNKEIVLKLDKDSLITFSPEYDKMEKYGHIK